MEKFSKTEGVLLALTIVFLLCTGFVFYNETTGNEGADYTIETEDIRPIEEPPVEEIPVEPPLREPTADCPLNLNTATVEELDLLPSVGPVLAERIVEYRTSHGEFRRIEDIQNVKGIGEGIFGKIRELITVAEDKQ